MTTLVRAETLKVLTLRYWWALAIAPVVVAVLIAASTRTFVEAVADSADTTFDVDVVSTGVSLGVSNTLVLVFAAVFGALTAGSNSATKLSPRRSSQLAAVTEFSAQNLPSSRYSPSATRWRSK